MAGFDLDRDPGRDRDRLVKRSVALVVLNEFDRLLLGWAGEPKGHVDPLKHRGIRAMADRLQVHIDLLEPDRRIAGAALDQQHAAGRHAGEERVGGGDLFTRTAEVRWLVDHELPIAHLTDRPAGSGRAFRMNTVHHEVLVGHPLLHTMMRAFERVHRGAATCSRIRSVTAPGCSTLARWAAAGIRTNRAFGIRLTISRDCSGGVDWSCSAAITSVGAPMRGRSGR